ncbi:MULTISPECIES: hypothetical protein [Pseudomonas]|uniref:Valyl-tRNA synthetase n=1 Tax=Pseudomonas luteola TaxID=47886 RepID=A0ABS0MXI0_PSELU|nr:MULTISPECIES: hypothetical protein [Pseudomonas]MBA1250293.1 hypothetical protein [Pseudomonas zeshuii]MBH3441418.1 hypothetical protein [Pseudomonas luteola]
MKIICRVLVVMTYTGFAATAIAQSFPDKSALGTTDLAMCTAAAMKSGQGIELYKVWSSALDSRYKVIYPTLSDADRDAYTSERIIDKRKSLQTQGIGTTPAFKKFYDDNCKAYLPQRVSE